MSWRWTAVLSMSVAMTLLASSAFATHVDPEFQSGNPTCIDLIDDPEAKEFRINSPGDGTFSDPSTGFSVTIDVFDTADGPAFDFTDASIPVLAVFVKGGPNGNLYEYDPPVTADTGLHSPVNPSNDKFFGLSHISFCWVEIPSTALSLSSASPGTTVHSGDDVTLTFAEANDGTIPLSSPAVSGNNGCTPAFVSGDTDSDGVLDPGETWLFSCTITNVTADVTITAIGSGTTPGGEIVTWCSDPGNPPVNTICDQDERVQVPIDVINPSTDLSLSSSSPGTTILAGTDVTLTFAEANDGDVPLTSPSVSGNNGCTPAFVSGDTDSDGVLDPGETWLFSCTITNVTADVTITAIASGVDPLGFTVTWCSDPGNPPANTICDQDERVQVPIDVINPSTDLSLSSADPGTTVHSGDSVMLTFAEHNDGDADLTSPTVTANNGCTPAFVSGDTDSDGVLDAGETWLFSCTIANVTSDVTVTAIASGVDPLGNTVTWCSDPGNPPANTICDQDERVQVPIDVINPSTDLSLSSVSPGTTISSGDSVTLTFAEHNDGDAELTSPMVTADNGCTPAFVSGDTDSDGVLDPGETWLFSCTVTNITSQVTITAIGSGVDPLGSTVTWCSDPGNPPANTICDQDERVQVTIDVIAVEGCTPGFWKTHPEAWGPTGFGAGQTLESVFDVPDSFGLDDDTLLEALDYMGGRGKLGAAKILLRAAVAAILNAGHPSIAYPRTVAEIVTDVNAALLGTRGAMLSLANALDADNNAVCPLD